MNAEQKNYLILSCTPFFGNSRFITAIKHKININHLITNPDNYKKSLSLRNESISFIKDSKYTSYIEKVSKWLKNDNNNIITYNDDRYPESLKEISNAPMILYCVGDIKLLKSNQLAVVGARKNSSYGKNAVKKIIQEITNNDVTITSGLAYGIDTIAHNYALEYKLKTIAVVGTGVDIVYPSSNRQLYEEISKQGLIVSEFTLGTGPLRHNFPQRNRIISGLSKGVLIVEAASRSGSLITAKLALEQNKEVLAIPGSIFSETSIGCNELIQQGAKLVNNASDIIEELNLSEPPHLYRNADTINSMTNIERIVFDCIDVNLTTTDQIINTTKLSYSEISEVLFELEMKSIIESVPGGYTNNIL